jgi:hypothetical protein
MRVLDPQGPRRAFLPDHGVRVRDIEETMDFRQLSMDDEDFSYHYRWPRTARLDTRPRAGMVEGCRGIPRSATTAASEIGCL